MKPRVVITGASGLLGANMARHFAEHYEVTRCHLSHSVKGSVRLDVRERDQVFALFRRRQPHIVVHAAAVVDSVLCQTNPSFAWLTNVVGTRNVAEACLAVGASLVFISTDWVFGDTSKVPHTEADRPHPLQVYGETKLSAESIALSIPRALVVRLTLLYGGNKNNYARESWPSTAVRMMQRGLSVSANSTEYRQPTLVDDATESILELLASRTQGIVHVASEQTLTKFDWLMLLANSAGLDTGLLAADAKTSEVRRPLRATISIEKLKSLGVVAPRPISETVDLVLEYSRERV